jgi:hypothetical protein
MEAPFRRQGFSGRHISEGLLVEVRSGLEVADRIIDLLDSGTGHLRLPGIGKSALEQTTGFSEIANRTKIRGMRPRHLSINPGCPSRPTAIPSERPGTPPLSSLATFSLGRCLSLRRPVADYSGTNARCAYDRKRCRRLRDSLRVKPDHNTKVLFHRRISAGRQLATTRMQRKGLVNAGDRVWDANAGETVRPRWEIKLDETGMLDIAAVRKHTS